MALTTARGTLALIELENASPDILFEMIPGATVPLWPDVRSGFISALQGHDFGTAAVAAPEERRWRTWFRLARSLSPSRWDAVSFRRRRPILFVVDGTTPNEVGARARNWLVGHYAEEFSASSAIAQWPSIDTPPPAFPMTRSLAPMVMRSAGLAKVKRVPVDERRIHQLVGEFAKRLDSRLTEEQAAAIAASATYWASVGPHLTAQFNRMLDRLDPQLVLMEGASYGGRSALVVSMKERRIHVAEPQHGWIGPSHGAYNFGKAMWSEALSATLPDELLTFGEYWGEGLRHPASSVVIGKPHLESMVSQALDWSDRPDEVLLVSSVAAPAETSAFAIALRDALPDGWTVRFRPHPSERATVTSRYDSMLSHSGIALDDNSDVYESLGTARGVVGVASTVLFEAVAMGCRVFVRDSPYTDYYVGDLFGPTVTGEDGIRRVVADLVHGRSPAAEVDSGRMWAPSATANFRRWVDSRVGHID